DVFAVSEPDGDFRLFGFQHRFVFVEFGLVHCASPSISRRFFFFLLSLAHLAIRISIDGISGQRFQSPESLVRAIFRSLPHRRLHETKAEQIGCQTRFASSWAFCYHLNFGSHTLIREPAHSIHTSRPARTAFVYFFRAGGQRPHSLPGHRKRRSAVRSGTLLS